MTDTYDLRHVEQRLAEDDRTAELTVQLVEHGDRLYLRGHVSGEARRRAVLDVVREMCPDCEIVDELASAEEGLSHAPDHTEEIR